MSERLKEIRESEEKSHIEMYSNEQLYRCNSWLKKPINTVLDLMPLFSTYKKLRILDLGCGVGRNCIEFAKKYRQIDCRIEGVDILPLAIEKLNENAMEQNVAENVCGIVSSIEEYNIPNNSYDLIMAVSALEHVDSKESFHKKLLEIKILDFVKVFTLFYTVYWSDIWCLLQFRSLSLFFFRKTATFLENILSTEQKECNYQKVTVI